MVFFAIFIILDNIVAEPISNFGLVIMLFLLILITRALDIKKNFFFQLNSFI